jgi:hypothetical protein
MEIITVSPFATPPAEVAERIRTQPECHLLWSVLQEGMETYMRYATATNRRGRRLSPKRRRGSLRMILTR